MPPAPAPPAVDATLRAGLARVMMQHWGHAEFRPLQAEAVAATLGGKDVLLILPTGEAQAAARPGQTSSWVLALFVRRWPGGRRCCRDGRREPPTLAAALGPLQAAASLWLSSWRRCTATSSPSW